MALLLCPSCTRHLRSDESACPFCHEVIPAEAKPAVVGKVVAGASRRQIHAARAVIIATAAMAACSPSKGPNDAPPDPDPKGHVLETDSPLPDPVATATATLEVAVPAPPEPTASATATVVVPDTVGPPPPPPDHRHIQNKPYGCVWPNACATASDDVDPVRV